MTATSLALVACCGSQAAADSAARSGAVADASGHVGWQTLGFVNGQDPGAILGWTLLVMGPMVFALMVVLVWNSQLRKTGFQRMRELQVANQSLSEIKTRFEALYNHRYQLTGLLDVDGRLIMANRKAEEFSGTRLDDLYGTYLWETPFWSHSKDAQNQVRQAVRMAQQGEFIQFESTHRSNSGELRNIEFSLSPVLDEDGKVIYLVPEGYDITERKQIEEALRMSEERNKTIVENSPIAIALLDTNGATLSRNRTFQQLLGYSPEEFNRMTPIDYTHPDDVDASRELKRRLMEEDPPKGQLEKRYIHKDGRVIWVNLHVNLVRDADGQPDFVIAMVEDITSRKEAEHVLKDQLQELQRWQEITIGREERMQKLKEEVDELLERLGEKPRYKSVSFIL